MYWVYQGDNWYASSWYNGPWMLVAPEAIPLFVLRVPVRYYRRPPVYFHEWRSDAPPHWGEHWGNSWEQRRSGWDMWDRHVVPAPAPLPIYQRQYSGNRYPRVEQQQALQTQNYRYQPQDEVVRQHYQAQPVQSLPAARPPSAVPLNQAQPMQSLPAARPPSSVPLNAQPSQRGQPPQTGAGAVQMPTATQTPPHRRPRIQASSRPSVSRYKGRKHRTTDLGANHQRKPRQFSIRPSNRSKPSVSPRRRSKPLPNVRSRHRGRKVRTRHRKARDTRRSQSRPRGRAPTRVSSKVGSTTNEAIPPRPPLLFPPESNGKRRSVKSK